MKLWIVVAFVVAIATPLAAYAYTQDEATYCWPEAKRLCTAGQIVEAIAGQRGGIQACFRAHHREVSRACIDAMRRAHGR